MLTWFEFSEQPLSLYTVHLDLPVLGQVCPPVSSEKSPLFNRFLDMQKYCLIKSFYSFEFMSVHVNADILTPLLNLIPASQSPLFTPSFILPPPSVPYSRSLWRALGRLQVLRFSLRAGWEARTRAPLRNVSVRVPGKSGALHEPSGLLSHRGGQMETDRPLHRA